MNAPAIPAREIKDIPAPKSRAELMPTSDHSKSSPAIAQIWTNRIEIAALIVVVGLAVSLHVRFVMNVGGLWRDEANSAHLANLSSLAEVWHFLDYDSFPILFFAVLRGWSGVFGANNDIALRALGLLTGLSILVGLWTTTRAFGVRWPLLSIALVGLNPMLIRYGDSTRAYGLGILLILLTAQFFWRMVRDLPSPPRPRIVVATTIFAVLSVQSLYYNSVLLFAIAMGAVAVAARARSWRAVLIIIGIGALAAASLVPYLPMMHRMHAWTFMVNYPVDFAWLWKRVREVIGSPVPVTVWIWSGLFLSGLGGIVWIALTNFAHARKKREGSQQRLRSESAVAESVPAAVIFASVALAVGTLAYACFLKVLNYYTQPWYYITLVAFAACMLEAIFSARPNRDRPAMFDWWRRTIRIAASLLLISFAGMAWLEMPTRHTNVDLLAKRLGSTTTSGDLILVPPWEAAITFCRYYRGPAIVVTLPPIDDHRFHRYDLILHEMMTPNPIESVLKQIETTLRNQHRVFVVGTLAFPGADDPAPPSPPAWRDSSGNWKTGHYYKLWRYQAGHFLREHALRIEEIPVEIPNRNPIQRFENLRLLALDGWHERE